MTLTPQAIVALRRLSKLNECQRWLTNDRPKIELLAAGMIVPDPTPNGYTLTRAGWEALGKLAPAYAPEGRAA